MSCLHTILCCIPSLSALPNRIRALPLWYILPFGGLVSAYHTKDLSKSVYAISYSVYRPIMAYMYICSIHVVSKRVPISGVTSHEIVFIFCVE